jgi:hypothetical protein
LDRFYDLGKTGVKNIRITSARARISGDGEILLTGLRDGRKVLGLGGYGSGERRTSVKRTVEDCCAMDANRLACDGFFNFGGIASGTYTWRRGDDEEPAATVGFEVNAGAERPWFRVHYTVTNARTGERRDVDETGALAITRVAGGGRRFWFTCFGCGRRVGKLYLPAAEYYFRCRKCHDLTYRSCQESHKYDRMVYKFFPDLVIKFGRYLSPGKIWKIVMGE